MKRTILINGALILVMTFSNNIYCQNIGNTANKEYPAEELTVHLSQRCLFPGEVLWFKIYCTSPFYPKSELSSVAYIELVNSSNAALIRKKIVLNKGTGNGEFIIPEDIQTGIYYIMAYTSWMKNFGEACFFKTYISLINPGEKFDYMQKDSTAPKVRVDNKQQKKDTVGTRIITNRSQYATRQKVEVKLETWKSQGNFSKSNYSIAIFRKEPDLLAGDDFQNQSRIPVQPQKIEYLPDYKGMWLAGNITDGSGSPITNETVVLSFPGPGTDFRNATTDDEGDFHFLLKPKNGEKDVVFTLPRSDLNLTLDETFWNGFRYPLTNNRLKINDQTIAFLKEKYSHFQLQKKFGQQHFTLKNSPEVIQNSDWCFYSNPIQILEINEYIKLDSLTEYFWELIPSTRFIQRKGKYTISITNPETFKPYKETPGVFVDGVLYSDYDKIASIPVEEVRQIVILDKIYYYMDFTFGGIIDIHTKKNDFNSVQVLPNMVRIIYPLGTIPKTEYITIDYSESEKQNNIPDLRYLLCWNSDIATNNTGEATFEFYTGDIEGEYIISVVGITYNGKIIRSEKEIEVKADLRFADN